MNVAIIGGGIAGLASAISLKRIGLDPTVYEQRSEVHHLGAGVVCWPNATFVLNELGLLEELQTVGWPISGMQRITCDGVPLGKLDIRKLDGAMGYPSLAVLRKDLMGLLLRHVNENGIRVHLSRRATRIVACGDHSRIEFTNGTSITPDLILGADGRMASIAREYIRGDNRPVFQGFLNCLVYSI